MTEEALFHGALAVPPAERAAYLAEHCPDADQRRRVEELLAVHGRPAGPLDAAPATGEFQPAAGSQLPDAQLEVRQIGPYKLLQRIGEGGMGAVYMAEQQRPVRRMVAVKVIKPGMDSAQVVARFEAERQALALMDHPNIARVLDAGTTENGRPFFVMELVKGIPITTYCDQQHLTPRERLELFVPVCHAVQHAHQKGVIHRDLKPTNVLVALYDGRPVPKVIDFGVAKALHNRLTEKTMFTEFGAIVGTLEYMSPEQAELNQLDIDTRSDIYSLGVLLYELLTGSTPFDRKRLKSAAFDELLRIIREEEPPKPSTRLSGSEELPAIAANRRTEPKRLGKLVRGELDWVVMKCLEKDRGRRYETANGLAMDVQRYLADDMVQARPPTAGYRVRKFARRHRAGVITAAAIFVGAVLSAAGQTWNVMEARRAKQEADAARDAAISAEREANRQRVISELAKQESLEAKAEADKQRDEARLTAYAAGMGLARRAWEENNVTRARELLDEVPRTAAGRDLRGFEWYYLNRLCHSEERTFVGHRLGVTGVAFSPDAQRVASASADQTVRIWDCATGRELFSLAAKDHVESVAYSPDGKRIASGSGIYAGTVKIWDSATGREMLSLKAHNSRVTGLAFSSDSQRLASASYDGRVKVWDCSTKGEPLLVVVNRDHLLTVAISRDDRLMATGGMDEKTIKIRDISTGNMLTPLQGHASDINRVAFSPDGRHLASASKDKTAKIWDVATGKVLYTLIGHARAVNDVAFSPDGKRLATASDDNTIKIWDSATGNEMFHLQGHAFPITRLALSRDGQRLASGSRDGTVKIWDFVADKTEFVFQTNARPGGAIGVAAFSPDGQRLAAKSTTEGTVTIWDSVLGKELLTIKAHTQLVTCMAVSADGQRLASGSQDSTVKVWDAVTGKELFTFGRTGLFGNGIIRTVAFSPDGKYLASGSDLPPVKIWDCMTGKELFSLKGHSKRTGCVAFSPDGRRLVSGGDDETLKMWDSLTGKELFTLKGHAGAVRSVAFRPDGLSLASGGSDNTVKIWDSKTGVELFTLRGHAGPVRCVAFTPDGQRLASGGADNTVKIWDSMTGKELFSFKGKAGEFTGLAFGPDGRRLTATNHFRSVTIWESSVSPEVERRRTADQ